ncbi:N-acetyltransferase [Pleomorphomonas sp. NRK KF1]|uniref:GNAT family N-acetyltransferase n=1 Tax=Pleomorphomonas sp. NRK KF1 TaxID=2943000 RepID=UPI0020445CBD|nr:GNAT family N-acetyltransferase [Pleomorphomonas sp. NRK KF1]MCM5552647.1 GNAT family N-acetyltransferase [Pleomorphomonas sp. NRK KF1]
MAPSPVALVLLDPVGDLGAVVAVYREATDYLLLETGLTAEAAAHAFFDDRPPAGGDASLKFGVRGSEGELVAIGDLAFGYPEADDAYLGLLLLVPAARGGGLGQVILDEVKRLARTRGATRLLLGVLDGNERARVFWERQGFRWTKTSGPHVFGRRWHVVHRLELPLAGPREDCP